VKNFFDPPVREELLMRLGNLRREAMPSFGDMNAAQMLAHCTQGMAMAASAVPLKGGMPAIYGWLIKASAFNEVPFRQEPPATRPVEPPSEREFAAEMAHMMEMFAFFAPGPAAIRHHRHPFFGRLNAEQWGMHFYKHLDHHLGQFGV